MARFGLVGIVAAAVHYCVALLLMAFVVSPLLANVVGYLVAFQVSFLGHFQWSFAESNVPRKTAMRRFFSVSLFSFLVNEALFAMLLKWSLFSPQVALLLVLFTVAAFTFLLSKCWAFKSSQ